MIMVKTLSRAALAMRAGVCASEAARRTWASSPPIKLRLQPMNGMPPRLLEVLIVCKHARMAERGHGGRRRGLQRPRAF